MPAIDDEDRIPLGLAQDDEDLDDAPDLGPDERDRDLLDGSWEQRYYAGEARTRDWNFVHLAIALMIALGLIIPIVGVFVR